MAKNTYYALILLLVLDTWSSDSLAAGVILPAKGIHPDTTCLANAYLSQVGVRELTNHNDGPAVEMYLHSCGLGKGYAWCSAFVKWCLNACGVDTRTITAWAATTYNYNKVVYARGRIVQRPQPGDVFQLWDYRYARVAHTGFYHSRVTDDIYESVEGNTNGGGSADGDGVYRRKRSLKATYALTRWL